MANITSNQTILLTTTLHGGVEPYSTCARWGGSYTANSGATGTLGVIPQSPGIPYITSSGIVCSSGTGAGTLTGTFYPNGFTGEVGMLVYAKDAVGVEASISAPLTYTVIPYSGPLQFIVQAGDDININGIDYTSPNPQIDGGVIPYTYLWQTTSYPSGSQPAIINDTIQRPTFANLTINGTYVFKLTSNDSKVPTPNTGQDSMNVIVTGNTDPNIVKIGTQTWSSVNLNVTNYTDGTEIPEVQDDVEWAALKTGAWCYYDNDPANEAVYGKLYNWYAMAGITTAESVPPTLTQIAARKKIAPSGYHVASNSEWTSMLSYLSPNATLKIKEVGTARWSPNAGATNSSGFTAVPNGQRYFPGDFYGIGGIPGSGAYAYWWTSLENGTVRYLSYSMTYVDRYTIDKRVGGAIRIVKD